MVKCDICGKESKYDGCVYYSEEEYHLCRSHYLKWRKHHKPYEQKHTHIKPCTKAWSEMCRESENLFKVWFKEQKKLNSPKKPMR